MILLPALQPLQAQTNPKDAYREQAVEILERVPLIDGHNDVPIQYRNRVDYKFDLLDFMNTTALTRLSIPIIPKLRVVGWALSSGGSMYLPTPRGRVGAGHPQANDLVYRMIEPYPELSAGSDGDDVDAGFLLKVSCIHDRHGRGAFYRQFRLAVLRTMYALGLPGI